MEPKKGEKKNLELQEVHPCFCQIPFFNKIIKSQDQDLSDLLKRAATPDKTIIMTAINDAWAAPGSLLDLFFESFHHGDQILHLLNHLVIVAMDQKAFERCKSRRHPYCYFLKVEGLNFASEQSYMKGDYLEMMWRRNRFQQSILELGYNFLFTVRIHVFSHVKLFLKKCMNFVPFLC